MRPFLAASTLLLAGCATTLPVSHSLEIDPGTAPSCVRACKAVGMQVAAIVFIRDMGGCVCEPVPGTAPPRAEAGRAGASAAQMGGAVLVMLEEAEATQRQQQQAMTSSSTTSTGAPGFGHR